LGAVSGMHAGRVIEELVALGHFYGRGADRTMREVIGSVAPHLPRYAEIVLAEEGFEIVTGGIGDSGALARVAARHALSLRATEIFDAFVQAMPDRMVGLKLPVSARRVPTPTPTPTLYVRAMIPCAEAERLCASMPALRGFAPALAGALRGHDTLYGIGVCDVGGDVALKTYAIEDVAIGATRAPGFVSYRITGSGVLRETKRYLPDVELGAAVLPSARWRKIVSFAESRLGWTRAGHFGVVDRPGEPPELKLYVERIGAIPTDFSKR
jgi:hypothetical protein